MRMRTREKYVSITPDHNKKKRVNEACDETKHSNRIVTVMGTIQSTVKIWNFWFKGNKIKFRNFWPLEKRFPCLLFEILVQAFIGEQSYILKSEQRLGHTKINVWRNNDFLMGQNYSMLWLVGIHKLKINSAVTIHILKASL